MRVVLLLLMLLVWPETSLAQFRIQAQGCVSPGQSLTINGRGFGTSQIGDIQASARAPRQVLILGVQSWSPNQVRVVLPRRRLKASGIYDLAWGNPTGTSTALGNITICAAAPPNRARAPRDVVPAPDGSPEYIVFVSSGQSQAAINGLQGQGATLLRSRPLPQMGRTLLMFAFPGGLSLPQARGILRAVAPTAELDLHNIYGFASANARLYAAAMIGDDPGRSCGLGRAVRVGLIDGPVNRTHPALAGATINQTSVLTSGERAVGVAHGTAVAALIGGQDQSGALTGFAVGAQIYAANAFSTVRGREGARLENVAAGMDWLLGKNVRIVNLSMSGSANRMFAALLSRARSKGMVLVAAAGNDATSKLRFPAGSADTIAVTAVDAAGRVYARANSGKHIEFSAPGVDIFVAKGNGGGYRSGTSYAAPIVTALLARQAARGALSLERARNVLRRGVRDLGPAGRDSRFGYGLVQTGGCK